MNDDYTQDSGVTGQMGDYSAPQPHEDYSAPKLEEPTSSYGQSESQSGSYGQSNTQTDAYQQQTGSYGQSDTQTGAYQQNSYQNPYSSSGTNSYTSANTYSNGNAYSSPYQQNSTNQSQNLYYGQAMQGKGDSIGFGVASMVLGILSIFTFFCCVNYIFAILAIIFGIVQLVKSTKKGMAITGIITAAISIIISIVFWVAAASESTNSDAIFDNYTEDVIQQEVIVQSLQ